MRALHLWQRGRLIVGLGGCGWCKHGRRRWCSGEQLRGNGRTARQCHGHVGRGIGRDGSYVREHGAVGYRGAADFDGFTKAVVQQYCTWWERGEGGREGGRTKKGGDVLSSNHLPTSPLSSLPSLSPLQLDQDLAFFDVNKSGELANRLSTDVHEVAEHLVENVSQFLSAAVMATASAGMLLYISPSLSLVTLSVVPAMVLGAAQYSKIVKKLSLALLNSLAVSTQQAAEKMGAIRIVRHFAAEEREKERYGKIIDESLGLAKKLAVSEGVYVAAIFAVSNFALLGVLFLGAGMVVEGGLTVGGLASYCLYATNLSTGACFV